MEKCVSFFLFTAGNANPSADKQKAPKSEMNNSRFGIATANKTIERQKKKNKEKNKLTN